MNVFFTTFRKRLFISYLIYFTIIMVWSPLIMVWAPFCFFTGTPACAQDKDRIGRSLIREVRLVGVKKVSKSQIRKQMAGLWPPPFWKFWHPGSVFTPDKLENSLNLVQQLYRQEGYYQTKISPTIDEKDGAVIITLHISEGPPVKIEDIIFEIRGTEGQPAPVADEWESREPLWLRFSQMIPLRKWAMFRIQDYEKSKTIILEYLANSGYPRAKLFGNVLIYRKENKAVIHLPIELGPFTRFGKIKILGNKNISLPSIMREVTFAEGETFSMGKIFQTQSRINGLGFFRSVLVNPVDLQQGAPVAEGTGPLQGAAVADVQILVQERKRRTVKVGLGYGTEDKLRIRLSGTYRNIFGGSRELEISFNFSDLAEEEALTFSQPYFPDPSSTSRWTLFRRRDKFISFNVINTSSEFRVDRGIAPMLSAFLAYRLDSSRISGLSEIARKDQEKVYFLSYFQTGLKWDTTATGDPCATGAPWDSPLDPTIGESATLFLEPSLQAIGSEVSYVKGTVEYKRYFHLVIGPVLAGRILMGTIQPFGLNQRGVPIMKKFFSGGTLSVRGYDYQKIGPYSGDQEPIGGNSLIEGSTELRIPLIGKFWGVLFGDFGNVFLDSMQFDFDNLRYSAGVGIRYKTIIGPLRLDIGYPLNPPKEVTAPYRIHFSIGQAF